MKNLLIEVAYVGLGTMAATKHRTEKWLEKVVATHKVNRDEGARIVEELKERISLAKDRTTSQVEDFIDRFSEKTKLAKEEVGDVLRSIIEKPKKAGKHMAKNLEELAEKISHKTAMTKAQAQAILHNFQDEVLEIREKAGKKGEDLLEQMNQMSLNGKSIAHELETRSKAILSDIKPRMQKAMDKTIDRLHLANIDYVHSLEHRIEELEQKENSK